MAELNPKIRGWTLYYQICVAQRTFSQQDSLLYYKPSRPVAAKGLDRL